MNSYSQLGYALLPEIALTLAALAALALDLFGLKRKDLQTRFNGALAVGAIGVVIAVLCNCRIGALGSVYDGVFQFDRLAIAARAGVLTLTLLVLGVSPGARPNRNPAEYVCILLLATVGLTLMTVAQQLLVAFLALELASLSLYILTGFDKSRPESAEAGLKYFLFGGISAAFLLFGFSLIYGLTGSIELPHIADSLARQGMSPLLTVALVMILVAFGFKAAAAPFHLWAPDAYQGAPAPSAALIASGSKLAGLVLFTRLLWPGLGAVAGSVFSAQMAAGWLPVVAVLSGTALLIGNLAALAQNNVRRLLAYSAIAHAGAMLIGIMAAGSIGPSALVYYGLTYGIATAGAFGVIGVLDRAGGCQSLSDLAGLHRRSPLLAACLLVFILSLAGVPPLAGFFGKFAVFVGALQIAGLNGPLGWVTVMAILFSAVALYYYMVILKQALVVKPTESAVKISVPFTAAVTLVIAAAAIVGLGVWPQALLAAAR